MAANNSIHFRLVSNIQLKRNDKTADLLYLTWRYQQVSVTGFITC